MKQFTCVALLLMCSQAITSEAQRASRDPGFNGQIMFGGVYLSSADNLSVTDEETIINDLSSAPATENRAVPGLIGEVNYTFEDRENQLFIGLNRIKVIRGDFAPEFGYRYYFGQRSKVEVAYLPGVTGGDTWSDPFLTNAERTTTSRETSGFRVRGEALFDLFSIEYAQGDRSIKRDRSGASLNLTPEQRNSLIRDADLEYLSIETTFPIAKGVMVTPGVYRYAEDAVGDANDFDLLGAELSLVYRNGAHMFAGVVGYEMLDFSSVNPVFNVERDENSMTYFGLYQYANPFGFEDTKLMFLLSNRSQESNVAFYEKESLVVGGGIVFSF